MSYAVHITARALADVEKALNWLERQSPQSAARWHARLLEKVATLETFPERCALAAEPEDLGIELHELLFGKRQGVYRILFTIEAQTVNVLHIRHASRDRVEQEDL